MQRIPLLKYHIRISETPAQKDIKLLMVSLSIAAKLAVRALKTLSD